MKTKRRRRWILWTVLLVVIATCTFLYFQRKEIVGKYVPEVTHIESANFKYQNDSLIGNVIFQIRNKSTTTININQLEATLHLDSVSFIDVTQQVNIHLNGLEADTFSLNLDIPVNKFFDFLQQVIDQDSVALSFELTITYDSKLGLIELPIKQTINIPAPRQLLSRVVKVELEEYKDKTAYADVQVYIYNPGRIDLTLKDFKYSFYTNGDISGNGSFKQEVKIKPGEESLTHVPLAIAVDRPMKTLVDVIGDKDTYAFKMKMESELKADSKLFNGCKVYFQYAGSFEVFDDEKKQLEKDLEKEQKQKEKEKNNSDEKRGLFNGN